MRCRLVILLALLPLGARAQVWDNDTDKRILLGIMGVFAAADVAFTVHDLVVGRRVSPTAASLETALAVTQGTFALATLVGGARGWVGSDGERHPDAVVAAVGAVSLAWAVALGVHGFWATRRPPPTVMLLPGPGAGVAVAGRW